MIPVKIPLLAVVVLFHSSNTGVFLQSTYRGGIFTFSSKNQNPHNIELTILILTSLPHNPTNFLPFLKIPPTLPASSIALKFAYLVEK